MTIRLHCLSWLPLALLVACGGATQHDPPNDGSETSGQDLDSSNGNGSSNGSGSSTGNGSSGSVAGNPGDPDAPVSSDPGSGGTSTDDGSNGNSSSGGGSSGRPPTCANGASANGEGAACNATFKGLCFATNEEACACAGCAADHCAVAESFPTQVSCIAPLPAEACAAGFERNAPGETRRCDIISKGLCFEDTAAACGCAGCATDRCIILESYPAQARCE